MPTGAGTVAMAGGAGHYPHAQSPEAVAELVIPFLKEHAVPRAGTVSSAEGVVTGAPRRWLGLEGLVLLAGALIAFGTPGQPWWLVPAAILAPDIAMTGYLAGTRPGAHLYSLAHAMPLPAVMLGADYWQADRLVMGPGPDLARPHRPRPAPRRRPEIQRPLHPHPHLGDRPHARLPGRNHQTAPI